MKPLFLETEVAPDSVAADQFESKTDRTSPWPMVNPVRPIALKPSHADLSIVIPCLDEAPNLRILLPRLRTVVQDMNIRAEICIVDGGSRDGTAEVARDFGARIIVSPYHGYGGALKAAFEQIESPHIITLDADFSHHPSVVKHLYEMRHQADIVIASRYIQGGYAHTFWMRKLLSRILNRVFRTALSLPVHDMSSGFRLYRREAIASLRLHYSTYAVLQEILTKAFSAGYQVSEIPFHYLPRRYGRSHARLLHFGFDYLRALREMWRVRNSISSADYETRAFHSWIPLQRYWQRKRYQIVLDYVGNRLRVLDVGCGSSQILNGTPQAVGLDIQQSKLRFMRRPGRHLINGTVSSIPLADQKFEVVICSLVVEHMPDSNQTYEELLRVLQPGGSLIIGTPDYGTLWWPLIEKVYHHVRPAAGCPDEHITRYTRHSLVERLKSFGLEILDWKYVGRSELIVHARKPKQ